MVTMFQFGATIGPSRTPLFMNKVTELNSMLPRPVVRSRPGSKYFDEFIKIPWMQDLVQGLEKMVFHHLSNECGVGYDEILADINKSRSLVPECLRLFGTCFNQLILIGEMDSSGYMPVHFDQDDAINVVVTLGDNKMIGGSTLFYGVSESDIDNLIKQDPLMNGRVIIGEFNKVLHGVKYRNFGGRASMKFIAKMKICNHFINRGQDQYLSFVNSGYPRTYFVAH
jgi:hypothetical protein